MPSPLVYPRLLVTEVSNALSRSPVVLLHGPRQCGKTTLVREFEKQGYPYISFDDEDLLNAARNDPKGYVAQLPEKVILDEVQRVPFLFRSIKMSVDDNRKPGRFLMTGSANVLLVPKLGDSLAGRMSILELLPLAQREIAGGRGRQAPKARRATAPTFIDVLLDWRFKDHTRRQSLLGALDERIAAGGYPAALAAGRGGRRWYQDYAETLIKRDVQELSRIQNLADLPRLLEVVAGQTGRLLNMSTLAAPFEVSRPTINQYVTLLSGIFLLKRLPPWHSNRLSRLTKRPKLHIGDTGLACALLGLNAGRLRENADLFGQLLESFVYQELRKQASWGDARPSFHHFRYKDEAEVDIVIESGGKVFGVEVKGSVGMKRQDFKGLRMLKEAAGKRFGGGVLLHDGNTVLPFGKLIKAVPLSLLWDCKDQLPQRGK